MLEALAQLEQWSFSVMLRETYLGFIVPLTLHSISMGFFIGCSLLIALRVIGVAPSIPLNTLSRLMPLVWLALFCSVLSGSLLLLAFPAKALTNWVFYFKLLALTAVAMLTRYFAMRLPQQNTATQHPLPAKPRITAATCIILAIAVVVAGRLLAYTHTMLMATESRYLGF
jgi:hypothetical protein